MFGLAKMAREWRQGSMNKTELQLIEQSTEVASHSQPVSDIEYQQLTTFHIDGELYGIDVVQVKEVLRFSAVTPVPGSDHYILGIINVRGNVVTIIDTRRLFNLPPTETDDESRIIVVDFFEDEVVGLVVDSVNEVLNLPAHEIDRAPTLSGDEVTNRFVNGVCYHQNVLIISLDLNKILTSIMPMEHERLESDF